MGIAGVWEGMVGDQRNGGRVEIGGGGSGLSIPDVWSMVDLCCSGKRAKSNRLCLNDWRLHTLQESRAACKPKGCSAQLTISLAKKLSPLSVFVIAISWSHLILIKLFNRCWWAWFIWLLNNTGATRMHGLPPTHFQRQCPFSYRDKQKSPHCQSCPGILGLWFCSVCHPPPVCSAGVSVWCTWWADWPWGCGGSRLPFLPHGLVIQLF